MADTEVWSLGGPIAAPAATDRVPIATGSNAGGYSPRSDFAYRDASGNYFANGPMGVGSASTPSARLHVRGAGAGAAQVRIESSATQPTLSLCNNSGDASDRNWALVASHTAFADLTFRRSNAALGDPLSSGTTMLRILSAGNLVPGTDDAQDIGSASLRWDNIRATNNIIQTSDATLKTVRGDGTPTAQEVAWAHAIRPLCFQMNDAIADKGAELAREHWGVLAQEVYQAGIDAGITDPFRHGFIGRDPLTRIESIMVPGTRQKMTVKSVVETAIEIVDGRAVLTSRTVDRAEPVFVEMPIYDESGALVMISEAAIGEGGEPIVRQVPMIHREPVMETIEIEQSTEIPVLDDAGEPEYIWSVRYTELIMFAWACGVFSTAA